MLSMKTAFLKGVLVCFAFVVVALSLRAAMSQHSLKDSDGFHFRLSSPLMKSFAAGKDNASSRIDGEKRD